MEICKLIFLLDFVCSGNFLHLEGHWRTVLRMKTAESFRKFFESLRRAAISSRPISRSVGLGNRNCFSEFSGMRKMPSRCRSPADSAGRNHAGLTMELGVLSENAAHRIAMRWTHEWRNEIRRLRALLGDELVVEFSEGAGVFLAFTVCSQIRSERRVETN